MKNILSFIIAGLFSVSLMAQAPTQTFIKGDLVIKYESRQKPGIENITDKYRGFI